jgi:RHS repeat-associated protein
MPISGADNIYPWTGSGYTWPMTGAGLGDVNGDGKVDVFFGTSPTSADVLLWRKAIAGVAPRTDHPFDWLIGVGTSWATTPQPQIFSSVPSDMNGDGITDILTTLYSTDSPGNWQWSVMYGSPSASGYTTPLSSPAGATMDGGTRRRPWTALTDMNGDGVSELVVMDFESLATNNVGFMNGGVSASALGAITPLMTPQITWDRSGPTNPQSVDDYMGAFGAADFNGDGMSDVYVIPNDNNTDSVYRIVMSTLSKPDLLTTVSNGLGGQVVVEYQNAIQVPNAVRNDLTTCGAQGSTPRSPASGPQCGVPNTNPRPLAMRVHVMDGRTPQDRSMRYAYFNGRYLPGQRLGNNDLGFQSVTETDEQTGAYTQTTYNQVAPYECLPSNVYVGTATGVASQTWTTYEDQSPYPLVDLVQPVQVTTATYEDPTTQTLTRTDSTTYDAFGNPTVSTHCDGPSCITKEAIYTNDTNAWIIGRASETRSYVGPLAPGYELRVDQRQFFYQPNGVDLSSQRRLICDNAASCSCPVPPAGAPWDNCTGGSLPGRWSVTASNIQLDAFGNVTYIADANGHGTSTQWDTDSGRLAFVYRTVTDVGVSTSIGMYQTFAYDWAGRPFSSAGWDGFVTTHYYDPLGRPRLTSYPNGLNKTWAYQNLGSPTAQFVLESSTGATGTPGTWTQTFFDGLGRTYQVFTKGDSGQVIATNRNVVYGMGGHALQVSAPYFVGAQPALWNEVDYDDHDRVHMVVKIDVSGTRTALRTTTFTAGAAGSGTSLSAMTVDANGNSSTTTFDAAGRISGLTDATGAVTYLHDASSRLLLVMRGTTWIDYFSYDTWGRRRTQYDASTGTTFFNYDDVGNLVTTTDAVGNTVTRSYDELNRVQTATDPSGTTTYYYDNQQPCPTGAPHGLGRLYEVTGSSSGQWFTQQYCYDVAGNVTQIVLSPPGGPSMITSYGFDELGRLKQKTMPNGFGLQYSYTDGGHLSTVTDPAGTALATFASYNARGEPTSRVTPAATTSYSYQNDGMLSTLSSTSALNVTEQADSYGLDVLGHLRSITDQRSSTYEVHLTTSPYWPYQLMAAYINTSETQTFTPDGAYRLMQATGAYGTDSFNYDANGNVTLMNGATFNYAGWPTVTGTTGTTLTSTEVFDAAGRRDRKAVPYNTWVYSYDGRGRQVAAYDNDALVEESFYGEGEERLVKRYHAPSGRVVSTFYSDDYEVREDSASAGASETTVYVRALGQVVAAITAGSNYDQPYAPAAQSIGWALPFYGSTTDGMADGTWYYLQNHLGSTAVVLGSDGHEVARMVPHAYGQLATGNSTGYDAASLKFTGKELDEESGLMYFKARFYDPSVGRFTTPDTQVPRGESAAVGFNRYAYAMDNPIEYVDPTGHGARAFGEAVAQGASSGAVRIDDDRQEGGGAVAIGTAIAFGAKRDVTATIQQSQTGPAPTFLRLARQGARGVLLPQQLTPPDLVGILTYSQPFQNVADFLSWYQAHVYNGEQGQAVPEGMIASGDVSDLKMFDLVARLAPAPDPAWMGHPNDDVVSARDWQKMQELHAAAGDTLYGDFIGSLLSGLAYVRGWNDAAMVHAAGFGDLAGNVGSFAVQYWGPDYTGNQSDYVPGQLWSSGQLEPYYPTLPR